MATDEEERFKTAVKIMKKENKEIMYDKMNHDNSSQYAFITWEHYLQGIDYLNDVEELQFQLLKHNIRTWRWGEQKYYRITFTYPDCEDHASSSIEEAFGHPETKGLTLLVKKEDFKQHKEKLYEMLE